MMAADPQRHHMSVEEYLELDRSSPDAKYEYVDGIAYNLRDPQALAGGTVAHARIALNTAILLDRLLADSSCQVHTSGVRVQVNEARYLYPAVLVSCDPADNQGDNDTIHSPRLIVEVLSPLTEAYDRGKKFAYYQQLASLQEYVLVNTQRQAIEVYTREGNTWRYRLYGISQTVALNSMNASFALATVYEHVQVDQD